MIMKKINRNDISQIANKVGTFIIVNFCAQTFFTIFLNNSLVSLLHDHGPLNKVDPIEIDMIVRSSISKISSIIIGLLVFKPNMKGIFSNEKRRYELKLKHKIKLTLLFISISLFSAIVSSFLMVNYSKYIMSIPMPETILLISIFGVLVAPITEEIFYRGIFLNYLKRVDNLFSIVISSIYFGVMHGIGFLHAFIIGLILGFTYILTGSIWWSAIIHFMYNLMTFVIEYLSLLSGMSYNLWRLIMANSLLLIFFITTIKDKEIKELYRKVEIKNIITQLKKDKEIYLAFIYEPKIAFIMICWIFLQMIPIFIN